MKYWRKMIIRIILCLEVMRIMVDVDNTTPTESQYERWKKGEEDLFIADGYIPACYLPDLPYEMTDEHTALLIDLYRAKSENFHSTIRLTDAQKKMLPGEEIVGECVISCEEINIIV